MNVKLRFENRDAAGDDGIVDIVELLVDRTAVPRIMAWYGGYYAGDDYDVFVNGREVGKDKNGEFQPLTIDA